MSAVLLSDNKYIRAGILSSLLLHVLLLGFLFRPTPNFDKRQMVLEVDLRSLAPAFQKQIPLKQQIVTESMGREVKDAPDTRWLAEKNMAVEKEQIKRGDAPDAGLPGGQPSQASEALQQSSAKEAVEKVSAPKKSKPVEKAQTPPPVKKKVSTGIKPLSDLPLDTGTLIREFAKEQNVEKPEVSEQSERDLTKEILGQGASAASGYQAFSRPSGTGAKVFGTRGSSDFLPNLPDGDITLLNTKASQFAVFVRRVALQVFGALRSSGWERLSASDIHAMQRSSVVRAILSKEGKLLSVRIETPSGSSRFDEVLKGAAQKGAADPHPPAGAEASDGNIHFIFQARSWSRRGASGRNGAIRERRWLMLATGLE